LNGADGPNAINYTIWSYCPDSTHQWGDGWNMEDLSLWSLDDVDLSHLREGSSLQGDEMSMYGMGRDDSQAGLLRRKVDESKSRFSPAPSGAGISSLSLTTLGPSDAWSDVMLRWRENPYDFLTDGARAVKAFSRPWPTKVVGKASDLQFDIGTTAFKLTVLVRSEDKLNVEGTDEKDLTTEIYVPLVHYAHPRLLSRKEDGPKFTYTEDSDIIDGGVAPVLPEFNGSSPTITNSSSSWIGLTEQNDVLDLDVSVSTGRWSVQGQTLKWWYDVPDVGEVDREYTVEIRRAAGAIKTNDDSSCGSWVEQLCPDETSCCVM